MAPDSWNKRRMDDAQAVLKDVHTFNDLTEELITDAFDAARHMIDKSDIVWFWRKLNDLPN